MCVWVLCYNINKRTYFTSHNHNTNKSKFISYQDLTRLHCSCKPTRAAAAEASRPPAASQHPDWSVSSMQSAPVVSSLQTNTTQTDSPKFCAELVLFSRITLSQLKTPKEEPAVFILSESHPGSTKRCQQHQSNVLHWLQPRKILPCPSFIHQTTYTAEERDTAHLLLAPLLSFNATPKLVICFT